MTQQQVDLFMASHVGMFPPMMMAQVQEMLLRAPENKNLTIQSIDFKNPTAALILSLFLGWLGVDRFYIGDVGMGIGKLLTAGGCGIWEIIDWFLIMDATRNKNFQLLGQALSY